MNGRILPTLAILLSVGIFFAYVKPVWSGPLKETREAIANTERALVAADEYKKRQNELAAARAAIDPENLDRLSVFLPDSVDNVRLILDINALAARSGLSLSNIDVIMSNTSVPAPAPTSRANPVGSVNLSLSAIGTYAALQTFLVGIEKSARLLDVRDIVVKGSDTGVYGYQMAIRLYWLR